MEELYNTACKNVNAIDTNSVEHVSEQLNQQIEYARDFEQGKTIAASKLFEEMKDTFTEKVMKSSENGKTQVCLMTVSTSPLTQHLATHTTQYVPVEFETKTIKYSYLAIFWSDYWRKSFGPFNLNYKWNSNKTLLYVNVSWDM